MTPDPVPSGNNLYRYVSGDPVNKSDRTGLAENCYEVNGVLKCLSGDSINVVESPVMLDYLRFPIYSASYSISMYGSGFAMLDVLYLPTEERQKPLEYSSEECDAVFDDAVSSNGQTICGSWFCGTDGHPDLTRPLQMGLQEDVDLELFLVGALKTVGSVVSLEASFGGRASKQVNRFCSGRVLWRMAEAADSVHNFPWTFDAVIFEQGLKVLKNEAKNYWEYQLRGSVNGAEGTFEIGVNIINGVEVIVHRFFRPDRR